MHFQVVGAARTGVLPLGKLEQVLSMCGMLPSDDCQAFREGVLRAVWRVLSGETGEDRYVKNYDRLDAKGHSHSPTCGVPVDRLSTLLATAALMSRDRGTERRDQRYGIPGSFPMSGRGWRGKTDENNSEATSVATFADDEDFAELCAELGEIYESNRLSRIRYTSNGHHTARPVADRSGDAWAEQLVGEGLMTGMNSPRETATPEQVAATTARFTEKLRMRERKIALLTEAQEANLDEAHSFEPFMTSTRQGLALRRRAAQAARPAKAGEAFPPGRGDADKPGSGAGDTRCRVLGIGPSPLQDRRTSEDREVDERCTFQPQFFRRGVVDPEHTCKDPDIPNRLASSCKAQVERLRIGRAQRLRRLEEKYASAARGETPPPSVQQLFLDAGLSLQANTSEVNGTSHERARHRLSRTGDRPGNTSPRLCLERRMRARHRWERRRSAERDRDHVEKLSSQDRRKRALARASRRAAASVGLEAALHARKVIQGRYEPPVLVAEVEFMPQRGWGLVPLWMDSCIGEATEELARRYRVTDAVVNELKDVFKNELMHLKLKSERGRATLKTFTERPACGRWHTVPKIVLRVDTACIPTGTELCAPAR